MTRSCRLRITRDDYNRLYQHLFPGDSDEHGAVLLAGISSSSGHLTLHVREVHLAREGIDYVEGKIGYRALTPTFIHKQITRARDERLAYIAVHNHASDTHVGFSSIDLQSHERGYPALLQISKGMPVGGMVLGMRSMQIDLWMPDGQRLELDEGIVVGNTILHLTPGPRSGFQFPSDMHERQIRMFGKPGQERLDHCRVAVVGLGGIGSLVAEYLARLGVGQFLLIDNDTVEQSNLSRIVGATSADVENRTSKVSVSERVIRQANSHARITLMSDDVARESAARALKGCDYLFLAADSMRARLIINAIVHQYLIPAVQLGSKIRTDSYGQLIEVMCANRPLRPGQGCLLCNQLIDATLLAKEAKSDEERKMQEYGTDEPNPSVISLNAVAAAHAVNDFLLEFLALRKENSQLHYEHYHFLTGTRSMVLPRKDADCPECSRGGMRFGRGDAIELPCNEG